MKKFIVELKTTAYVHLSQTIKAKDASEARRIFVGRIGKWESTQPRHLPDVELTHSLLPNQDYSGDELNVEECDDSGEES